MEKWRIVSKDGNPDKHGFYDAVVIWRDEDGIMRAEIDGREYGPAELNGSFVMDGQPKEGLAWISHTGGYIGEQVYAWLPLREYPEIDLPEGVVWYVNEYMQS